MTDELQDFEMKSEDSESSPEGDSRGSSRWLLVLAAVVVVLLIVGVLWIAALFFLIIGSMTILGLSGRMING